MDLYLKMDDFHIETKPEKVMREELERRGINVLPQHPTRLGFVIDFAIPEHKLIIEVDGEYWHEPNNKRDRFRDYMHKRGGWKTLRFTDKQIYDDVKKCVDKIQKEIKSEK